MLDLVSGYQLNVEGMLVNLKRLLGVQFLGPLSAENRSVLLADRLMMAHFSLYTEFFKEDWYRPLSKRKIHSYPICINQLIT